jgi:hypothetical protein
MTPENALLEAYAEALESVDTVIETHGEEPRLPHQTFAALNILRRGLDPLMKALAAEADGSEPSEAQVEKFRLTLRDLAAQLLMIYATSGWAANAPDPTEH